jgi:hypothetical protein
MSNTDRAFFKKYRDSNFRLRRGSPAEIERIACRALGKVPDGFASTDFDADHEWRVLVVNAAPDILLRMLVVRPKEEPEDFVDSGATGFAFVFGRKIVMDRIAG